MTVWVVVCSGSVSAKTIPVPGGGDLAAALRRARAGDSIILQPRATYVGNFMLPDTQGDAFITIRPSSPDVVPEGTRITPAQAASLPKLRSPNNEPVVQTAPGVHHWRLVLLELQGGADGDGELLALGTGSASQNLLSQVPHDLVVDRCYIHGNSSAGKKRCVGLNSLVPK